MNEKLILLEDINGLGKAGETVTVTPGYARNYLLPKKLALKASKGAVKQFEALKEKIEAKRLAEVEKMQALAAKIAELEITISMNVGEDEKLYGSVTSHNIADEIKKLGVEIDPHKLVLASPIKELGAFDVDIKLHPEVVAKARVWVVRA